MTDSEIVKALECCKNLNCSACPKKANLFVTDCDVKLCEEAIGLIKRQQTELEKAKFEAVREFAEKLKRKSELVAPSVWAIPYRAVAVTDIDRLLEGMGCNDG